MRSNNILHRKNILASRLVPETNRTKKIFRKTVKNRESKKKNGNTFFRELNYLGVFSMGSRVFYGILFDTEQIYTGQILLQKY